MAIIHSSRMLRELQDAAKIQISRDKIPNQIADKVVPVMEVNPRLTRIVNVVRTSSIANSTSSTIYTTPINQDFYLTNASLAVIKDATATATYFRLNVVIDGATQRLLVIPSLTLTAQTLGLSSNLMFPLKVDRNTAITIDSDTNVANHKAQAVIVGYIDEQSNA